MMACILVGANSLEATHNYQNVGLSNYVAALLVPQSSQGNHRQCAQERNHSVIGVLYGS